MSTSKYNILDLFSGAGGLSLGFSQEDEYDIKVSIDYDDKLSLTYIENFPSVKHLSRDILSFSDKEIRELNKKYNFEIIIGGPPCQGFSLAGNIGRTEKKDKRNDLFIGYLKFVRIIKPSVFIMENVARLETHNKGKTLKTIIDLFKNEGYFINYKVLNAKDYGVAQNRNRIFIVGTLKPGFEFPEKKQEVYTIKDVIGDLPVLSSGEKSKFPNHNAMNHTKQMLNKMSFIKDGGDRFDIPKEIRPKSGDVRKYMKYKSDEPSICITGDMRKVFHYNQNRALTNRELARIQSFPDDFIFYGTSISIQQQIGNAVPPKLSNALAKKVKEFLLDV